MKGHLHIKTSKSRFRSITVAGFYIRTLVNLLNVAGEMNKYVPREKTECMSSTIMLVKGNKNVLGSYCKLEKRELGTNKMS